MLAEAGYPGGRGLPKIEILYNPSDEHQSIAEFIQAQWKENLGVEIGLQSMEWGPYLAAQQNLQYAVSRAGWVGDYLDPNTFLDMWMSDNPNNQTGWSNKEYDKLITAAAAEARSRQADGTVAPGGNDCAGRTAVHSNLLPRLDEHGPAVCKRLVSEFARRPSARSQFGSIEDEKQKFLEGGGRG